MDWDGDGEYTFSDEEIEWFIATYGTREELQSYLARRRRKGCSALMLALALLSAGPFVAWFDNIRWRNR